MPHKLLAALVASAALTIPARAQDPTLVEKVFGEIAQAEQMRFEAEGATIETGQIAEEFGLMRLGTRGRTILFDDGRRIVQRTYSGGSRGLAQSIRTSISDGRIEIAFYDFLVDGIGPGDCLDIRYKRKADEAQLAIFFREGGQYTITGLAIGDSQTLSGTLETAELDAGLKARIEPFARALEEKLNSDYQMVLSWSPGDPFPVDLAPYRSFVEGHENLLDKVARGEVPGIRELYRLYGALKGAVK